MSDLERPHLVPRVRQTGRYDGHEIEFEKRNRFGERASSFVMGELSLDDLEALYQELGAYLDETRHLR